MFNTYNIFQEAIQCKGLNEIKNCLFLHTATINRWLQKKEVPNNYFNDINHLLGDKYEMKDTYREKDQFFTNSKISQYCYDKTLDILKNLDIDTKDYIFIEPSAGCCSFYNILPQNKRIGIDIDPKDNRELIKTNYLDYTPKNDKKYIVIGNPPFGLRGNLALRFINHSYNFADVVAFILPPLFDSTGKGVPMTRIKGYKLAHSEKLPLNSFQYPNGEPVNVATIFQVWTKINTDKIKIEAKKTCKTIARVFSLSDGGTPASTRNKKMLNACDVYLPSTCFNGMKPYKSFEELPNRRGYGVVFYKDKDKLKDIFF
ncbi:MAG: hypothetical protein Ta2D_03400 [Rickettsiales bacterium]|nr:MAG: hypothetical protein Ta2D_03400 [Rickettsiales bacterium]